MAAAHRYWWEKRATVVALVLAALIPLIWPPIPPLVDLPGHMGRYRVQLDLAQSPALQHFYEFRWALIGNLGVDLLVIPFAKLFGLELGTKLIVMTIPALTVAGLLWIGREVHGEVQPTALFALPLAYGHPFLFGFVNFALSMALALLAFALWLRLARLGRLRTRVVLFTLIGPLIWVTHTFGWGTLGVLAFSAELIRQHDKGQSWLQSLVRAGIHCLALAPPLLLMILWRSGHVSGVTADWFNWNAKWLWAQQTLRDRWEVFDLASMALIAAVFLFALAHRRIELSRNLGASALFLLLVFLLLPRIVFGSAYADMRLTPYLCAIAIVAIRLRPDASRRLAAGLALAGLAFFGVRLTANTVSLARASTGYQQALGALDQVPIGARMVSFVGHPCAATWSTNRMEHLPALAIVRRHAYSNDQWLMPGAQLMTMKLPNAGPFLHDPSQIVTAGPCPRDKWRSLTWSLANFPRTTFDYVWLIDPPRFDPRLTADLTLVWQDGSHRLYSVNRSAPLQPPR